MSGPSVTHSISLEDHCGSATWSPPAESSHSTSRGKSFAGKRSRRDSSASSERVRLPQPLLPHPQEVRRPSAHPQSQTTEPRPHEMAVQNDFSEADPLAYSPKGLVLFTGSEGPLVSHPLASVKRGGDLQALSINSACLEFGPNESKIVLKPRQCPEVALHPI